MAWARHGHGMASVNQTRPHCVNQMGKTHSKPLAARHGRGTAWARHAIYESALKLLEPSGPHRACYGIPLPFVTFLIQIVRYKSIVV